MPKEVLLVRAVVYGLLAGLLVAFLTACGGGDEEQGEQVERPDTARPASVCNERPEVCR